jgi:hypothetical protein
MEAVEARGSVHADFNGDGREDLAFLGELFPVVTVLLAVEDEQGSHFVPAASTDVPVTRILASGDVDGDGEADLIGSGEVLWTALSSRPPRKSVPEVIERPHERIPGLVINEILAWNTRHRIELSPVDGGKWDFIEVYNGSVEPVHLDRHFLLRKDEAAPPVLWGRYQFPPFELAPGQHLVVACTASEAHPLRTGFKLPQTGATLVLAKTGPDPDGELRDLGLVEVDRVTYPPQRENISYARYRDGTWSFVFNPTPTPGAPNVDNGVVAPTIKLEAIAPDGWTFDEPIRLPEPGEDIRFLAVAHDDVGIASVRLFYRELDSKNPPYVILYDDGLHGDGGLRDGLFSNTLTWEELFGEGGGGGGSCVSVEVEDLDGEIRTIPEPDEAEVGELSDSREGYCVLREEGGPRVRIAEVVSSNELSLQDDASGSPDWVEVVNVSSELVSMAGVYLGERFPDDNWFRFPAGLTLAPYGEWGDRTIVYCDRKPEQGSRHSRFELNSDEGGHLVLTYSSLLGTRLAHRVIDSVRYPPLRRDEAWARREDGHRLLHDSWDRAVPTPEKRNPLSTVERGDTNGDGKLDISDGITLLQFLFSGQEAACVEAGNVNDDRDTNLTDAIVIFEYLFRGGPPPVSGSVNCF